MFSKQFVSDALHTPKYMYGCSILLMAGEVVQMQNKKIVITLSLYLRYNLQLADTGRWEIQVVLLVKMIVRNLSTAEA